MTLCFVNNIDWEFEIDWTGQDLLDFINKHTESNFNTLLLGGEDVTNEILSESGVSCECKLEAYTAMNLVKMVQPRQEEFLFPKQVSINGIFEELQKVDYSELKKYESELFPKIKLHYASETNSAMNTGVYLKDDSIWCTNIVNDSVHVRLYCKECCQFYTTSYCMMCANMCSVCNEPGLDCICD